MNLPPVLLERLDRHAGSAPDEPRAFGRAGRRGIVLHHMIVGDDQPHRGPIDESRLVSLNRRELGRGAEIVHRRRVLEPDFGDAVVHGLPASVGGGARVRLNVASHSRELRDHVRVPAAPVGLELLDRHPGASLEERESFHHGFCSDSSSLARTAGHSARTIE